MSTFSTARPAPKAHKAGILSDSDNPALAKQTTWTNLTHMMDLQRLDIGNALYYVELKSNGHRPLFAERLGFSAFIEILSKTSLETDAKVVAYCLLQDTVYLIIQNGNQPLLDSTRHITQQYTLFAQKEWNHHGSLFNKHHHYLLLEPSRYLLSCIQYVHQRPVAMGLVAEASIYPWSSLQSYAGEQDSPWLEVSALQQFTGLSTHRRHSHLECLRQGPSESLDLQQGNHPQVWALASEQFIQQILRRQLDDLPAPDLGWLTKRICNQHHIDAADLTLRHGHRRHLEIKAEIAALLLEFYDNQTQDEDEPEEDLAQALEQELGTSFELLAPLMLTLRETRPHYLHNLYLELKQQWRATSGEDNIEVEKTEALTVTEPLKENQTEQSTPSESGDLTEESPSLSE